ncbi:site-specific DNA-methyltransferase [Nocardiopsis rhodophaea]|uniref:Methyltransferase n=1 Tax=Nocardiopsis rhodophaea TaxID=280238 RepID=A0ABP5EA30_9ACTN
MIVEGDVLAVLPTLDTGIVDAVICDPPYNSGGRTAAERRRGSSRDKYTTGRRGDLRNELPEFPGDNRDQRSWGYWCSLWLSECLRLTVPGGSLLVACDWRQLPAASDAVQAAGWVWSGVVTWVKPRHRSRPTRGGFWRQTEYYLWGTAGPVRTDHEVYLPGVVEATAPAATERQHPTEKPLELMRELVRVAPPGGTVLDPFAGSGSTGVAAVAEGRRFVGVELSAHYAEVARTRLAAVQPALDAQEA